MRKHVNKLVYWLASLVPALACALLLSNDQALCAYARHPELCLRENSLVDGWWKVAIAAGLGVLFSHAIRWSANRQSTRPLAE